MNPQQIAKMLAFGYDVEYYDAASIATGTLNYRLFPRTAQTGGLSNYRGNPFNFDAVQWLKISAALDLTAITDAIRLVLMKSSVIIQKNNVTYYEGSLFTILGPASSSVLTGPALYYNYGGSIVFKKPIVVTKDDELIVNVNFADVTGLNGQKLLWYFRGIGAIGVSGVR